MVSNGKRALALATSMCILAIHAGAADSLHLHWNELAPLVAGKGVWLTLNNRVRVAGVVRAVAQLQVAS
jgi:hypothetical protein